MLDELNLAPTDVLEALNRLGLGLGLGLWLELGLGLGLGLGLEFGVGLCLGLRLGLGVGLGLGLTLSLTLNRLLDDNRELLVPETSEVVRPHPHFMLFATQNPPGSYGGRKVLSRAFRSRLLD